MKKKEYELTPKKCLKCAIELPFKKRVNKFCSSACAASYNNILRGSRSVETKNKISNAMLGRKVTRSASYTPRSNHASWKIQYVRCSNCNALFVVRGWRTKWHRTTCSEDCRINRSVKIRPYINGTRKLTWYHNSYTNSLVLLESSWEVELAEFLDVNNINWIRPGHIKWFDGAKTRLYYPDFYLPEYDLYLDPKNPYGMARDAKKMNEVKKSINVIYGDINNVKDYVIKRLSV